MDKLDEQIVAREERMAEYLGPGQNTHRAFIEGPSYELEALGSGPEEHVVKHLADWLKGSPLEPGHRAFVVKVIDCYPGPELVD